MSFLRGNYALYKYGFFSGLNGEEYKLEITRRGWDFPDSAQEEHIEQGSVELDFETEGVFTPVNPSSLSFTLIFTDSFAFRELFTADDELFRVSLIDITAGARELIWAGYIVPDEYNEAYKEPPLKAKIKAIGGLGLLEQKFFSGYESRISVAQLLHGALLEISQSSDTEIYNGILYERLLSRPDHIDFTKPLLPNVYHDLYNYTERSAEDPEGEDFNLLDIVKEALRPYGAVLQRLKGGAWMVFEPQARAQDVAQADWFKIEGGGWSGATEQIAERHFINFTGGGYSKQTDYFPVLRDQKLNIEKASKTVDIEFEATKPRQRSLIKDPGFLVIDDENRPHSLKYWDKVENSQNGIKFKVDRDGRPPQRAPRSRRNRGGRNRGGGGNSGGAQRHRRGSGSNVSGPVVTDVAATNFNVFIFQGDGKGYQAEQKQCTPADFIKSEPVLVGVETYLFSVNWQFAEPFLKSQRNDKVSKYPDFKMEVIVEGNSGDNYWLAFDKQKEAYEFIKNSSNQITFNTGSSEAQDKQIEFDVPETGYLRISFFGYGRHTIRKGTTPGQTTKYRVDELAIWNPRISVKDAPSLSFSKLQKKNQDITYSSETVEVDVIHWDKGDVVNSTGDVTRDQSLYNTGGWVRKNLESEDPCSLLENLANQYLDTFSLPLRVLSGTFNRPDRNQLMVNSYKLIEGNKEFTLYPVRGTINFCTGFANMELQQIEEPSKSYYNPAPSPILDEPRYGGGTGPPVIDDGPGLGGDGGVVIDDQRFDTGVVAAENFQGLNSGLYQGGEPLDPEPGGSIEWLSDGTDGLQAGQKYMKTITQDGQKIYSQLSKEITPPDGG